MKIPEVVRVAGRDLKVEMVPYCVNTENHMCYGTYLEGQSTIQLNTTNSEHQYMGITLWHELFHALIMNAGLDLADQNERICDLFAAGVYQILQDNGQKFFDLKEVDTDEAPKGNEVENGIRPD